MTFSLKAFALDLLGLDMSRDKEEDLLCPEIMEDSEEDESPGNGEKEEPGWMPFSIDWLKPSTATNNLKWTIRFNCSSPKSIMLLGESANHAVPNRVIKTLQKLTAKKKSVIRIRNDDALCCARALVTAKAKVDQHPQWESIRKGGKLQRELALQLHNEAHVPPGPCGYKELTKFSTAPSLYDYQIVLVYADRSYYIKTFGPTQPKQLILLHQKDHYDVITSLPGFFGTSYVCAHCLKPYANPIDVQTTSEKSSAAPVSKKSAPISFTLTHGVSKPLDVARTVIVAFSVTPAFKHIWSKTTPENPRPALRTPSAFVDADVLPVSNWK